MTNINSNAQEKLGYAYNFGVQKLVKFTIVGSSWNNWATGWNIASKQCLHHLIHIFNTKPHVTLVACESNHLNADLVLSCPKVICVTWCSNFMNQKPIQKVLMYYTKYITLEGLKSSRYVWKTKPVKNLSLFRSVLIQLYMLYAEPK